jgi:branched-subunit amino acid aminotransferase/4-amino-4-deoxychorismate lyase
MIGKDKPSFKGSKVSESINRAFMYGESVFTTMRMINGQLMDWNLHFERLRKGVDFVYGPFTDGDEWVPLLKNRVESRIFNETGDKVLRVTVYREQARGLVRLGLVSINDLKIQVSTSAYDASRFEGKMLKLRTCSVPQKPYWWPSFLKTGNYLETILSQKNFMKPGDDDVLFLSNKDTVTESSIANIFVVRHNILYTAPLGPNVLEGIMRRKVMEASNLFFDKCEESETSIEQLLKADAVFGTNSVRGPFLVDRIDDREIFYTQEFLTKFEALKQRVFG